jgi:Arc/MetJ-type ribon-helix-helix transcriptional regulator
LDSEVRYVTVSIPKAVADRIDFLIGELGYWPSRGSFVREACLEKIRVEMLKLSEFREAMVGVDGSVRCGEERQGTARRR